MTAPHGTTAADPGTHPGGSASAQTTAVEIRTAGIGDLRLVARTLAAAFRDGDLAPWLMPDPDERSYRYLPYFGILAEGALQPDTHARPAGIVHLADHGAAVAVWYPSDSTDPADQIMNYQARIADAVGPAAAPRFTALDTAMADHHHRIAATPHHHLAFLAVHPDHQNRGLGSALLRHHLQHLDAVGLPASLDATGPRNSKLYEQHGFHHQGRFRAGDSPPLYAMWRPPARAGTSPAAG